MRFPSIRSVHWLPFRIVSVHLQPTQFKIVYPRINPITKFCLYMIFGFAHALCWLNVYGLLYVIVFAHPQYAQSLCRAMWNGFCNGKRLYRIWLFALFRTNRSTTHSLLLCSIVVCLFCIHWRQKVCNGTLLEEIMLGYSICVCNRGFHRDIKCRKFENNSFILRFISFD